MKRKFENESESEKRLEPIEKIQKTEQDDDSAAEDGQQNKGFTFDVKHFRKELKKSTNKSSTLIQFLHVCTKSKNNVDYLKKYLESGGTPAEILGQLDEHDRKNLGLASTVFSLLNVALLKIQSGVPHLMQSSEDTCRYFLNSYVPVVEAMLSEKSNAKQQRVTLKLLSTIVVLNAELGVTILNELPMQPKTILHLTKHNLANGKHDVREAYVHFVASFLVENSTQLTKALLEKPALLNMVMHDLVHDGADTILMVAHLLKKSIVDNLNLSKTLKIRTFNHSNISSLFNLFNWKGVSAGKKMKKQFSEEEKSEIDATVSALLEIVCTSHKCGIYFSDKFLGTGETSSNSYLLKAFESLETPWNNKNVRQLLLSIIQKCPDLYPPIKRNVDDSLDMSKPDKVISALDFLKEAILTIPEDKILQSMPEMEVEQIFHFLRNTYFSNGVLKITNEVLNSSHIQLKCALSTLLTTVLEMLKHYYNSPAVENVHGGKLKKNLQTRFLEVVSKQFPNPDTLLLAMHKVLDDLTPSMEDEGSKSNFLINILNLLLSYSDMLPNSLDPISTMLDSKRLFEKIDFVTSNRIELKLKTTMFLLRADEFAFSTEKPLFKNVLSAMLEVYTTHDNSFSETAKNVLHDMLKIAGIFDDNTYEIDLLLHVIRSVGKKYGQETVPIAMSIIENVVSMSYTVKYRKLHFETLTKQYDTKCFDEIFTNIANFDNCESESFQKESNPSFFMTGLLLCSRDADDKPECFVSLIEQFLINLLHFQNNPELFWNIVSEFNVSENAKTYIIGWKSKPVNISKNVYDKNDILYIVSKYLLKDELSDISSIFIDYDFTRDVFSVSCIFHMVVFYLLQQHKLDKLNENRLKNACSVITCIIDNFPVDSRKNRTQYLHMIGKCLDCKTLQEWFSPLKKEKHAKNNYLTSFVLTVIDRCNNKCIELAKIESFYKPYKQNLVAILMSELTACKESKKGVYFDNANSIFSMLKYDTDSLDILSKEILLLDIKCMVIDDDNLSSWVNIVCHALNTHAENRSLISRGVFTKTMLLYVNIIKKLDSVKNILEFEECLYNFMSKNPIFVKNISVNIFKDIFQIKCVSKCTPKILSMLLATNKNYLPTFSNIIVNGDVIDKRELVFPLCLAAFVHGNFHKSKSVLNEIFNHYKPNIMKIIEKPHKTTQIYVDNIEVIYKLVSEFMEPNDCAEFFKKVMKFESVEEFHIGILEILFFKSGDLTRDNVNNFLLCLMNLGINAIKRDNLQYEKILKVANVITKVLDYANDTNELSKQEENVDIAKNSIWKNFYKHTLSSLLKKTENNDHVKCELWFDCICRCIQLFYKTDDPDIAELFEMITTHSDFFTIMLSTKNVVMKKWLVKMIATLLSKNKSIMKSSHIALYLSSYQATMKECDQIILSIIKFYEANGIVLAECKPYLWGEAGANHFSLRSSRKKSSLWSNPTVHQTLSLIDKEKIELTIKHFPNRAKLNFDFETCTNGNNYQICNIIDDIFSTRHSEAKENKNTDVFNRPELKTSRNAINDLNYECNWMSENNYSEIYDPRFLLPLLNFVLVPGTAVSCQRILRCGIIAIPLIALSSDCSMMRAAAYNVLYRFSSQLESETRSKNDKILWAQFINTLKSSLTTAEEEEKETESNPKISNIGALYLARAALVMTNPSSPLFKPVNDFIITKQHINFTVAPDFLDLFHNSDISFHERRVWILEVLRDGIENFADVKVLLKSVLFKLLFDFYSSVFADNTTKLLILEIVAKTVAIPKAAKVLIECYGLMPWFTCVCKGLSNETKNLFSVSMQLCYNSIISLIIDSALRVSKSQKGSTIVDILKNEKSLAIRGSVERDVLFLFLLVTGKLSKNSVCSVETYLNILRKISAFNWKFVSQRRMMKLVNECRIFMDSNDKNFEYMITAVENRDENLLSASKMFFADSGSDNRVSEYLGEIICKWI